VFSIDNRQVSANIFKFSSFELDLHLHRLIFKGQRVEIGGQPLAILEYLVKNSGLLVSRTELSNHLWPNSQKINTSRRINVAVRTLRHALNDTADQPLYIETIRGHGYRFITATQQPKSINQKLKLVTSILILLVSVSDHNMKQKRDSPPNLNPYLYAVSAMESRAGITDETKINLLHFSKKHPNYKPAQILMMSIAIKEWRVHPNRTNRLNAQSTVNQMEKRYGAFPQLLRYQSELSLFGKFNAGEAHLYLEKLTTLIPEDVEAHRLLAWLNLSKGDLNMAWKNVELLLAKASQNPELRAEVGWLLLRLDKPELAISLCNDLSPSWNRINTLSCLYTAQSRSGFLTLAKATAIRIMKEFDEKPDIIAQIEKAKNDNAYQIFSDWRIIQFDKISWFQKAQLLAEADRITEAEYALDISFKRREPHIIKLATSYELMKLNSFDSYNLKLKALKQ